ncbi:MAG: hypothetical protein VR65_09720 [Desulfobulbaceae bacterium BRH_c16a]|nr:MAG: hypothetical protein VR65_09720 [Desulfobulbaceae bacterium BRH_c16a]
MLDSIEKPAKPTLNDKPLNSENGLQGLVAYYQNLFDREENFNYYSPDDFQNAKRKFVKYLLNNRAML